VKLLLLLLILGVLGMVIAVAAGSISGGLGDPAGSTPDPGLPPGPLTAADLERVRFAPALRGYRMDQVEALLDRLRDQLAQLEAERRTTRLPVGESAPLPGAEPVQFDRYEPAAPACTAAPAAALDPSDRPSAAGSRVDEPAMQRADRSAGPVNG
jgi:DivIVA domain-containing protein